MCGFVSHGDLKESGIPGTEVYKNSMVALRDACLFKYGGIFAKFPKGGRGVISDLEISVAKCFGFETTSLLGELYPI